MIRFVPPPRTQPYPYSARDVAWRWEAEWTQVRGRFRRSETETPRD